MSNQEIVLSEDQVKEVIAFLLGSPNGLDEAFAEIGVNMNDISMQSFEDIDAEIFQCDSCGWWYEAGDDSGDNLCYGCYDQQEDDAEDEPDFDDADDDDIMDDETND